MVTMWHQDPASSLVPPGRAIEQKRCTSDADAVHGAKSVGVGEKWKRDARPHCRLLRKTLSIHASLALLPRLEPVTRQPSTDVIKAFSSNTTITKQATTGPVRKPRKSRGKGLRTTTGWYEC